MEQITLEQDITVAYVPAPSFPEGINAAHDALHLKIPPGGRRRYFGLSRPEQGVIQYKAAAEELQPGEASRLHCPSIVIRKGPYIALTVADYREDPQRISQAFATLLQAPDLDPQGYCVEWYFNDTDVRCMIRLEEPANR